MPLSLRHSVTAHAAMSVVAREGAGFYHSAAACARGTPRGVGPSVRVSAAPHRTRGTSVNKVVISVTVVLALLVPTAPAAQAAHDHYGESARHVAREIHCKRFDRLSLALDLDSGVCRVKGRRVYVITFRSRRQQREWNEVAHGGLRPDHWWANGKGAIVTARNGNRAAARIGARRLPGALKQP